MSKENNQERLKKEILELFCGLENGLIDCTPEAEMKLYDILNSHTLQAKKDAVKEEREKFLSILDDDSCECDNCHRRRAYFRNPEKELLRYKNKREAEYKKGKMDTAREIMEWAENNGATGVDLQDRRWVELNDLKALIKQKYGVED